MGTLSVAGGGPLMAHCLKYAWTWCGDNVRDISNGGVGGCILACEIGHMLYFAATFYEYDEKLRLVSFVRIHFDIKTGSGQEISG